jgi:molecular chaperone GrpE
VLSSEIMSEDSHQQTPDAAPLAPDAAANDSQQQAQALSPEAQLNEAQQKLAELQDAFLRAKAETENMRRRAQLDVSNAHKYAVESFSAEMLSVKDSLEAALAVANATTESMKSGVELTLRQLTQVFEKFKLAEVNPLGEKFDPHRHQAIGMIEAPQPANTVVSVLQKGYVLQDRVLRPALVTVSKGAAGGTSDAAGSSAAEQSANT